MQSLHGLILTNVLFFSHAISDLLPFTLATPRKIKGTHRHPLRHIFEHIQALHTIRPIPMHEDNTGMVLVGGRTVREQRTVQDLVVRVGELDG